MKTTKHLTVNRCISAVLLLAMLLAMGIFFAGCNAAVVPDADPLPTAAPTATPDPTPTPVPTPTPEPTPTPLPEGWIIDPKGNVPPEREIILLAQDDEHNTYVASICVAKENDEYYCEIWSGKSCLESVLLPEDILQDVEKVSMLFTVGDGGKLVRFTLSNGQERLFYRSDNDLILAVDSIYTQLSVGYRFIVNTAKNIVVEYNFGETYYTQYVFPSQYDIYYDGFGVFKDRKTGEILSRDIAEVSSHELIEG